LFDNYAIHYGHANTYAFKHKCRNLTLTPLSLPKLLKSKLEKKREKSLFMSATQVKRALVRASHYLSYLWWN